MKQKNKFIKERLKHKQEQLSMQAIRQERLNRTMQNTKDDIDQAHLCPSRTGRSRKR